MRKSLLLTVSLLILALMTGASASGPLPAGLEPGEFVVYNQEVPVNLVFVGYEPAHIDEAALLAELPATYDPLVRIPQFYGLPGRPVGLHFDFVYDFVYADASFENRFFHMLSSIGDPGALTVFQEDYNAQVNNVLDVAGPVLYIDGPSVEEWLMNAASRALGLDTHKGYTIFFVNWYGREDFQFHVYTKTDEPDSDTGYNFGEIRDSRKMIAWGGTHGRTWFYDLSAGPEAWTDNWNVDNPDLNGNGVEEYRMPPIWEYTAGGYRDPAALSSDLGLVTRFVGIDLLFTPSPLYDPLVTTPGLNGDKVIHIEMFEDDPAASGLDWINTRIIRSELGQFEPYYPWHVALEDNNPIDPGAELAFRIFTGLSGANDCWNAFGTPFAELFCYFDGNLATYVPPYGPTDYVGEVFAFNTTDANLGAQFGLLGFADDNWVDGTQSYVFEFDAPFYRLLGYGFTGTTIHEVGHHIGLSHPHDGYDSEFGIQFGPRDDFYFAWSGNESDTVMHYMVLSNGFGKFNQDSMYRYEMAGYLNWSNDLLDDILAHPNAGSVQSLITRADNAASRAVTAFEKWNYLAAVRHAYDAYTLLLRAADILGIDGVSKFTSYALPSGAAPHEGDPIRFPDN